MSIGHGKGMLPTGLEGRRCGNGCYELTKLWAAGNVTESVDVVGPRDGTDCSANVDPTPRAVWNRVGCLELAHVDIGFEGEPRIGLESFWRNRECTPLRLSQGQLGTVAETYSIDTRVVSGITCDHLEERLGFFHDAHVRVALGRPKLRILHLIQGGSCTVSVTFYEPCRNQGSGSRTKVYL